jgi:hypothetical protein
MMLAIAAVMFQLFLGIVGIPTGGGSQTAWGGIFDTCACLEKSG